MSLPGLLLTDDFQSWGKFIGMAIVAIFWGIGAFSSMVKKANERAKRNAALRPPDAMSQARRVQPAAPVAQMPAFQSQRASAPLQRNQNVGAQHAKQLKAAVKRIANRPAQPAPPPLPPMQSAPVSRAGATTAPKPASAQPVPRQTTAGSANAATIRRWLQPGTIRRQFILTELFQPALALRDLKKPD